MKAQEDSEPSKKAAEYAEIINALLDLTSDDLDYRHMRVLVNDRLSLAKAARIDLVTFVAALARSLKSIREAAVQGVDRASPQRRRALEELQQPLEDFCKTCAIDPHLALVSVRLRQGDFFILEDLKDTIAPLLPSPDHRKLAMGLCGLLTLPIVFKRPFGTYPTAFSEVLSFESACENVCSILHINPIVPRLAALDEGALKLVQEQFGFSRKGVEWREDERRWRGSS